MRTIMSNRWMLVGMGLLAAISAAACAAKPATSSAGPGSGQTVSPAANTSTRPAAAQPGTPAAAAPSASQTGPDAVQNLVISQTERASLRNAFLAAKGITSPADVYNVIGPIQGTVYYAYDPLTGTYWAMGTFYAGPGHAAYLEGDFQNGGGYAMYKRPGAGPWQVQSAYCPRYQATSQFFPPAVLMAWSVSNGAPLPSASHEVFAGVNC